MKSKKRGIILAAAMIIGIALLLAFPFGPLLPWSPLKPGYGSLSTARAEVFFDKNQPLLDDYKGIEQMMREAEGFHGMTYRHPVKVIACKNWSDCERALPWMGNLRAIGGVTLATGDVIYITPKLKENNFSTAEFLRHELSHALISQHTTMRNSLKMTEQAWFSEGLAVSFSKQTSYLSQQEFLDRAVKTDLGKVIDPARMNRTSQDWNARLAYPAQRYFIEHLRKAFGEENFQRFLQQYIHDPDHYAKEFQDVYGQSLPEAISQFEQTIKNSSSPLFR